MADNPDPSETNEPTSENGHPSEKPRKRRRLVLIGAAVAAVLALGGGAYYAGFADAVLGSATERAEVEPAVFHPVPDLVVSLNAGKGRPMFLKVRVTLELAKESDISRVDQLMPRIIDYCQIYLRELRPEDLQGSAGTLRLQEELLRRIAAAVEPTQVKDVLFSELLLQ